MSDPILSATRWPSNAHLMDDVYKLGYLDGYVLDCTFGLGNFWTKWEPPTLVACDLDAGLSPLGISVDFRDMPFLNGAFNSVVFDPPYKLNGTPDPVVDTRYGVHESTRWQDRMYLICCGIIECARVLRQHGFFLLKCQDQVCSGKKRWQTIEFTIQAEEYDLTLIDRFDMLVTPRPQPEGRRQVHSLQNHSTLLVFQKEGAA